MADGTIITHFIDALAVCSCIVESAHNEICYIAPPSLLVFGSRFDLLDTKTLIQKGGLVRGIANFSHRYINKVQEILDKGTHLRYSSERQGIFMLVGDGYESISAAGVFPESLSIDTPIVALWNFNPAYGKFLMSAFESTWERSIPARQRIQELLAAWSPDN